MAIARVVLVVVLASVAATVALLMAPSGGPRTAAEVPAATSCGARTWTWTPVTCRDAQRSISLGPPVTLGRDAVDSTRIWLTTLGAVRDRLHPPHQSGHEPDDPSTPVWVFIYDFRGLATQQPLDRRLLHVVSAVDIGAIAGEYINVATWRDIYGSSGPPLPATFPAVTVPESAPGRPVDPSIEPVSVSHPSPEAQAALDRCLPADGDVTMVDRMGQVPHARDVWRYVPIAHDDPVLASDAPAWVIVIRGAVRISQSSLGYDNAVDPTCVAVGDRHVLLITGPVVNVYGQVEPAPSPARRPAFALPTPAP